MRPRTRGSCTHGKLDAADANAAVQGVARQEPVLLPGAGDAWAVGGLAVEPAVSGGVNLLHPPYPLAGVPPGQWRGFPQSYRPRHVARFTCSDRLCRPLPCPLSCPSADTDCHLGTTSAPGVLS